MTQADPQLDFGKLVAPLEGCYCPDSGRPVTYPEVMVRALLIVPLYNSLSFRRLYSAIEVDRVGYMVALAHNVLKMVRRLGRGVGPPGAAAPADGIVGEGFRLDLDDGMLGALLRSYNSKRHLRYGYGPGNKTAPRFTNRRHCREQKVRHGR